MSESWSYKDIDVYISLYDNILGDIDRTDTRYWVPLSNYGLLRGRVAVTPSTLEGNSESIPGRDGKPYSKYSSRGNAKLTFEILVADEMISDIDQSVSLEQRFNLVEYYLNNARRLSYKQPGKVTNTYFEVYKMKLTENDAYKEARTIKVEVEVNPFEFNFTGNTAIPINASSAVQVSYPIPNSPCKPSFLLPQGFSGSVQVGTASPFETIESLPAATIVDSLNELVYAAADTTVNLNAWFSGDFEDLIMYPSGGVIQIINNSTSAITFYGRGGIIR